MKTLFSILVLAIIAVIVNFVAVFILNIAGVPGALIAGMPGKHNRRRFVFGSVISAIGQSYVYLAYTAFVVNWTMLARSEQGASYIIWPFAFLSVNIPIWLNLMHAKVEAREMKHVNAQTEALHMTFLITFICFFIFAFVPRVMEIIYNWVPYIGA